MQVKCKIVATVLQDEVREFKKDGTDIKEHTLTVHQDGQKETLKVIVPMTEEFEVYKRYEFEGELGIYCIKGNLYTKFRTL